MARPKKPTKKTRRIAPKRLTKNAKKKGPAPKGTMSLIPYIAVKGAAAAIAFYKKVLDAKELYRLTDPAGHIGHAELKIGDGVMFLSDEAPAFGALSPHTIGGTPIKLHIYVADADKTIARAQKAGATVLRPAQDQFYGDRSGMISDPFGHQWFIASRKKDVTPKQMQKHYTNSYKT